MKPEEIIDALRDPERRKDSRVTYDAANWIEKATEEQKGHGPVIPARIAVPLARIPELIERLRTLLPTQAYDDHVMLDSLDARIAELTEDRDRLFLESQRWHGGFNLAEQRAEGYRVQHLRLQEVCARHEATIRSLLGENARLTEQRAEGYRAALEHLNAGKEDLPEWAERFVALALAPDPARPTPDPALLKVTQQPHVIGHGRWDWECGVCGGFSHPGGYRSKLEAREAGFEHLSAHDPARPATEPEHGKCPDCGQPLWYFPDAHFCSRCRDWIGGEAQEDDR